MTNQEALIAKISVPGYSSDAVNLALLDFDLNPEEEYDYDLKDVVTKAAIDVLESMLSVERIQEGGYSITYSIGGVKARIAYLKGGTEIASPKIRNKSYLW